MYALCVRVYEYITCGQGLFRIVYVGARECVGVWVRVGVWVWSGMGQSEREWWGVTSKAG